MRKELRFAFQMFLFCGMVTSFNPFLLAGDAKPANPSFYFEGAPLQQAMVDGNTQKFQAQQWMNDNYTGGIRDASLNYQLPKGTTMDMGGHALMGNGDYEGFFHLKNDKYGFANIDFTQFRKYYDNFGGVYHPFTTLNVNELDKDLSMDIGKLAVEAGITLENLPRITFFYEHRYKSGEKSHLTWTAVKEGALTRDIGPSYQDIEETTDTFAVNAEHEIKGFDLNSKQQWEFVQSKLSRKEQNLSTTSTASDKKIRVQDQNPETRLFTSTSGISRNFFHDKVRTAMGYRFARLTTQEIESIFELNQNWTPQNFSNPKQIRGARADGDYGAHTWVADLMLMPWKSIALIPKLKIESMHRDGTSAYPSDSTPSIPDGIINTTEISNTRNKIMRFGEGVSLRFTGIPRTSFYNDLEFEQTRSWLGEDRNSLAGQSAANANEIFSRETITYVRRGIWTVGGRVTPWNFTDWTFQVRHKRDNNDYDDQRETLPGSSTARSAFIDWQNIDTDEFTTRITLRPYRWLQPAFRYNLRDDDFFSKFENERTNTKTETTSHVYSFDVIFQPRPDLMSMVSFSRQNAYTVTPAAGPVTPQVPGFQANVDTWLFDLSYSPHTRVTFTGSLMYSKAKNFNDFALTGLPLGADNDRVNLETGIHFKISEHVSIEPKYMYYRYKANAYAEYGDYDAHIAWLDFVFHWV